MRKQCCQRNHTEEPCVQLPACMTTEYQEKFLEHRYITVQSTKTHTDECQPLEGTTTFTSDSVTHKLMHHQPKVSKPYVPPESHMKWTGCCCQDDPVHPVERRVASKMEAPTTKMVSQSVYKDDFRPWNVQKRQPYRLYDNLKLNKGKFEMTTTSKDAYSPKNPVKVTENFKPIPQLQETLPFDSTTNYRSQYVTHPVQFKKPRENPTYQPNSTPHTRVISSHEDYKGLPTEPVKSFKPKVAWERNPAVFDGKSEFSDKFKTWPLGPKFHHKAEEHKPPEGRMEFLSTTRADYTVHECQRPKSARPPRQVWVKNKEPFQAKSTMKEDYKVWGTMRRSPIVHKEEWERPKESFEKTTTSRSVYTPKTAQRVVSCKPAQRPLSAKPMLEETTVCRSCYTAKDTPRCSNQCRVSPGFEHNSMAVEEHRLYHSISDTGDLAIQWH